MQSSRVGAVEGDRLRLAELLSALSLATDLGMGQPLEHGLRTAIIAVRLAERLGLDNDERAAVYYVSLLRFAGCTAESHLDAGVFGDEIAARRELTRTMFASRGELLVTALRNVHPDETLVRLVLLPVALRLLGAKAWWIPAWLDRLLPQVNLRHGRLVEAPAPAEG